MRKFKFRAWITPWGNSESYMQNIQPLQLHVYFGNWERGGYKEAIFQQFTGYKDSEGHDIFEGDILKNMIPDKYAVGLFVVKWGEFEPSDDMGVGGIGFILPWFYCNFKPKIIGNIFEHSDLLK